MITRPQTRRERYQEKSRSAQHSPVHLATVDFIHNSNVAFLARALACFGGAALHVIGHVPPSNELRRLSGSHSRLVDIYQYHTPDELLQMVREEEIHLISLEITDRATSLLDTDFPLDRPVMFVLGHEETGVPEVILQRSDQVLFVPMPGPGYCLNTSQTGNLILYEYMRRLHVEESTARILYSVG